MTESQTLLAVEQKIIDAESRIERQLFLRRLALISLLLGIPLLVCGVIAVNVFVDYSRPGNGRFGLNFLVGIPLIFSLIGAPKFWFDCRESLVSYRGELRKLEAERRALQAASSRPVATAFREYYESVAQLRDDYRHGATKYRSRHNSFQIAVTIGSILTSVSTTASAKEGLWSWLAVALSATVSISAGMVSYFKFRERSMNLQQTADALDLELQTFTLGIRRYRSLPSDEAETYFAEEVERLKEEQRKKDLQLEQSPEAQQRGSAAAAAGPAQ